ncbi:hypothetical protein COV24_03440 [candidate division WWE3 bacterium CG10_big_fil_rev_8_21_14_0_10_32_10]|uniref:Uncharacterized protein n=1 Tax=candidate division WWE3 bacterium CG10_big_fil_rev_8_21_14_0_10_32_10 TaxID=1975090 RepID=A0A2H0RAC7_UNCKA|nr:MAG: hypothetical protein COV24_03440 [candidate division WWE3 bacterium CG10_big_fil_rev_8_21_14_0_10_32_10]
MGKNLLFSDVIGRVGTIGDLYVLGDIDALKNATSINDFYTSLIMLSSAYGEDTYIVAIGNIHLRKYLLCYSKGDFCYHRLVKNPQKESIVYLSINETRYFVLHEFYIEGFFKDFETYKYSVSLDENKNDVTGVIVYCAKNKKHSKEKYIRYIKTLFDKISIIIFVYDGRNEVELL